MATFIVDASNGVVTAAIGCHGELEELRDAWPPGEMRSGLGLERQVMVGNHVFHHGDRLLMPVDSLAANRRAVRFQWAGWKRCPLSAFGEQLCSNDARKKPVSLQTLWASHQATMQGEGTATNP